MVHVVTGESKARRVYKGIEFFIATAMVFGVIAYNAPLALSCLLGAIIAGVCTYNIYKPHPHEKTPRHRRAYWALALASPILFIGTITPKAVTEQDMQNIPSSSPLSTELMPKGSEFLYNETDAKRVAWIMNGKSSIKLRLKDPDSAKFRGMFFANNVAPVACGEVNSKNSLGGYTGYKRFVTGNRIDLTFVETDMGAGEFDKVWKELCSR